MDDEAPGRDAARSLIAEMVILERNKEERIRKGATLAWAAVFGVVPLLGLGLYLERNSGGLFVEVLRAVAIVVVMAGGLSLTLAVLLTVAWLFRSRSPTLAAIEQRLAVLERLLVSRESVEGEPP
jgi:hypothetical protein